MVNDGELIQEIINRPHIFVALVQNALTVAQSLRDNYFADTARLISKIRNELSGIDEGKKEIRYFL